MSRKMSIIIRSIIAVAMAVFTILSASGYSTRSSADNVSVEPAPSVTIEPAEDPVLTLKPLPVMQAKALVFSEPEPIVVEKLSLVDEQTDDDEPVATDYAYGFTLHIREMMAKTLFQEANRSYIGDTEASKVVWTWLNRFDSGILWFGYDMEEILTKEGQYAYYESTPVTEENLELINDVIERWVAEKNGATNVGRTLPQDFYSFHGDGKTNYFYKWSSGGLGQPGDYKIYYDGSLGTPYDN